MLDTLRKLCEEQVRDLFNAETQLSKALPRMAKAATNPRLRSALAAHLEETQDHITRLRQIAEMLDIKPGGKKCKAMEGLIAEGKEVLAEKETSDHRAVIDLALIAAAQRIEHYEIAAYSSAAAMAHRLGELKSHALLRQTLEDEKGAVKVLTAISESEVLNAAARTGTDEDQVEAVVDDTQGEENRNLHPSGRLPLRSGAMATARALVKAQ